MRATVKNLSLVSLLVLSMPAWSVVLTSSVKNQISSTPSSTATNPQYEQGLVAMEKKQFDLAEKLFKEAAKTEPASALPWLGLAEIARLNKKEAEAEKMVRKADEVAPDSLDSQLAMGRLLYAKKNYTGAEARFLKASALAPSASAPRLDLAELYMTGLNNPGKAAEFFRQVISLKPDHAGAHFGLGNASFILKNYPDALLHLAKASNLSPDNPIPKIALSQVQAATGDDKAAIASLQEAAKLAPKMADVPLRMGVLYQQTKHWAEAYTAYENALRLNDQLTLAYNNLAWMAADRKERLDDALRWANKAVELAPNALTFKDTLAWVKRARGDTRGALELLLQISKTPNPSAEVFYHLALVRADAGQKTEALAAFKRVLQIDPSYPQVDEIRAKIKRLE